MLAWATEVAKKDYEKLGYDWRKTPVTVDLVEVSALLTSTKGPSYASTLHHVGTFDTRTGVLQPGPEVPDGFVAEWLGQVRTNPVALRELARALVVREDAMGDAMFDKVELYAAHVRPTYYVPKGAPLAGKQIEGLRPFGEVRYANQFRSDMRPEYRLTLRNVRASGLAQAKLYGAAPPGALLTARNEAVFVFHAPYPQLDDCPWAGLPSARLHQWIEEEPQVTTPDVEVFSAG